MRPSLTRAGAHAGRTEGGVRGSAGRAARRAAGRGGAGAQLPRGAEEGLRRELELPRRRRQLAGPEGDAAGPGGHLRARRQGGLSIVGADECDSGPCRRRRRNHHGRAHAARRKERAGAGGRACGRREPGVHHRRRAGHRRAGLRHRDRAARGQDHRPGQRLCGQRQAAGVRHRRHRHDRRPQRDPGAGRRQHAARLGGDGPVLAGRARRAGAKHPAVPRRRATSTRCRPRSTGCCPKCRAPRSSPSRSTAAAP